jgi:hypothetical protein
MTSVVAMEGQLRELKEKAAASAVVLRGLIEKVSLASVSSSSDRDFSA